jgi:hypothetical protein
MNCEKCQELLSDFVDGTLTNSDRHTLSAHLEECLSCVSVHTEINSIVSFCREHREEYVAPPNAQALWLRISNTVEGERAMQQTQAAAKVASASASENFLSRLLGRSWELSFPQMVTAVTAIIVAVALATAFGLQRMHGAESGQLAGNKDGGNNEQHALPSVAGGAGFSNPHERLRQQEMEIEYLTQRVEPLKVSWNPQIRETFERNMSVYDRAIEDSLGGLKQNPHDEISEEMLTAALDDKKELLKEFADIGH